MSIENFVKNLRKEIKATKTEREAAFGPAKGALTRKLNDLEAALTKATRKGIQ